MEIVNRVGLMLFDQDGRILLLKELESKSQYGKMAGMLSVPIKTIAEGETTEQALMRLLVNEVGAPIVGTLKYFQEFNIKLNDDFTACINMYVGTCAISFDAKPTNTNVMFYGWMPPNLILDLAPGRKRLEVEPVLRSYLEH